MQRPLTKKQEDILQYVTDNVRTVMPTYREIASHFGISLKGAYDHVNALVKKGYIKKLSHGHRDIKIIKKEGKDEERTQLRNNVLNVR